ncbi:MAG: pyrophosphohydrolase including oxidative damage repair enzyme [Phenylobacterium sp.]|jgi:nudix-type nucleoside diphosphatase (YffH/AdpP family)|nr:pyrophosphohydrolase including oxidative damage repair enzyme [Phenylobacterium sp.]
MPVELRKVETVYQGYSTLMVATLAAPDGGLFKREIEHHGHAVGVLPYDPQRRMALLVSLPRAPVIWAGGPQELVEAPAGMIDDGDPEATARREALEEVGVHLGPLEPVASAFASPGVSSERVELYLAPYAARDRIGQGGGVDGEQENITVIEVALRDLWTWVDDRRIEDLKTLTLVLALKVRRPELFAD